MPRSHLNRLVQENKRYYSGRVDDLRRDIDYLERVIGASIQDSDERLSGTNPKLEQKFALMQGELGIEYHVMAYVLSDLTGRRDESHLAKARELLRQAQAVPKLSPRG